MGFAELNAFSNVFTRRPYSLRMSQNLKLSCARAADCLRRLGVRSLLEFVQFILHLIYLLGALRLSSNFRPFNGEVGLTNRG